MRLFDWCKNRKIERRINRLSEVERQEIIEKSPYEIGVFQGEGYHVFLKSEPDFTKGYVDTIGEVSRETAENWLIKTYWKENENNC
jgi:hypothetical protein